MWTDEGDADQGALRREVISTCRQMNARGINRGTSRNVLPDDEIERVREKMKSYGLRQPRRS